MVVGSYLELALVHNTRWLDVGAAAVDRLFTARVSRIRGTYSFTNRTFARAIGQYVSTTRTPTLYVASVAPRSGTFSGSVLRTVSELHLRTWPAPDHRCCDPVIVDAWSRRRSDEQSAGLGITWHSPSSTGANFRSVWDERWRKMN